jgi:hypothetical protein
MISRLMLLKVNKLNYFITEKKINFKKNIKIKSKITNKEKTINNEKIKVLGNFFKLKYKKTKKLVKFNLCLAHKIYLLKNKSFLSCFKKIKKNKIIFLEKNSLIKNDINKKNKLNLFFLKKKRPLNAYTKKGIKISNRFFKQKTGKKTSY